MYNIHVYEFYFILLNSTLIVWFLMCSYFLKRLINNYKSYVKYFFLGEVEIIETNFRKLRATLTMLHKMLVIKYFNRFKVIILFFKLKPYRIISST